MTLIGNGNRKVNWRLWQKKNYSSKVESGGLWCPLGKQHRGKGSSVCLLLQSSPWITCTGPSAPLSTACMDYIVRVTVLLTAEMQTGCRSTCQACVGNDREGEKFLTWGNLLNHRPSNLTVPLPPAHISKYLSFKMLQCLAAQSPDSPISALLCIPKLLYCSHLFRVTRLFIHPGALFLLLASLNLSPANLFPVAASITGFFWLFSYWISAILQPQSDTCTKLFPSHVAEDIAELLLTKLHPSSSTTVTLGVFYTRDWVLSNNFWEPAVLLSYQPMHLMPLLLHSCWSLQIAVPSWPFFFSEKAHCWLIFSSKDEWQSRKSIPASLGMVALWLVCFLERNISNFL